MALITEEIKEVANKTMLFAVATCSKEGVPNVVPIKFVKVISDDQLLVMDNFMEKTEANIKANPKVAVSCWFTNPETKLSQGYQFKGDATFEYSGKHFDEGYQWVKSIKPEINPKAAIIVKVTSVYDLRPHP